MNGPKNHDVKYEAGILWYFWCGKWCPVRGGLGAYAGGGGGGGGITGIQVQDEGANVNGLVNVLNFIGQLVEATAGTGKINITIKIPSMTEAQRLALVPTTALIVEDTTNDMYYKWSTVTNSWSPF